MTEGEERGWESRAVQRECPPGRYSSPSKSLNCRLEENNFLQPICYLFTERSLNKENDSDANPAALLMCPYTLFDNWIWPRREV